MINIKFPDLSITSSNDFLRPSLTHVEIGRDRIVSLNSYLMIVLKTKEYITNNSISKLDKPIYVKYFHLKYLKNCKDIKIDGNYLNILDSNYVNIYIPYYNKPDNKYFYPDYEKVINFISSKNKSNNIDVIHFDNKYLSKVFRVLPYNKGTYTFFDKYILIEDYDREFESYAILMPLEALV